MNNLPQANYRGWKQTQANKQPQIKRKKKKQDASESTRDSCQCGIFRWPKNRDKEKKKNPKADQVGNQWPHLLLQCDYFRKVCLQ